MIVFGERAFQQKQLGFARWPVKLQHTEQMVGRGGGEVKIYTRYKIREVGSGQNMNGIVSPSKEFGFYSKQARNLTRKMCGLHFFQNIIKTDTVK